MSKAGRTVHPAGMQPKIPLKVQSPFGPRPKSGKRGILINGRPQ